MVLHNGSMQHFACRSGSQDALFNFNSSVVERGDDAMASASKLTAVMCEKIVEDLSYGKSELCKNHEFSNKLIQLMKRRTTNPEKKTMKLVSTVHRCCKK
jgi:hypothetical protein